MEQSFFVLHVIIAIIRNQLLFKKCIDTMLMKIPFLPKEDPKNI